MLKHQSKSKQFETAKQPEEPQVRSSSSQPANSTSPHPAAQKPPLNQKLVWSFAFVVTTMLSATMGATLALVTPLAPIITPQGQDKQLASDLRLNGFNYRLARPVNILVMGIDRVPEAGDNSPEMFAGRSDTMLLLRIDPTDNSVKMLSVPRDTQVEIPGIGIDKINDANATGGPALAARVTSRTLNNVPIDRYVRVSTDAFRELVDLMGGVEVFVPAPMSYVDQTQKLKIDLAQGWQTLNGNQAEQFARFRNDGQGDIGRVQRQQALIKALRSRLTSPAVLPRLPRMVRVMQKYIDTNLSLEEMLALVNFGIKLDQDNFKMVLLPGRFSTPDEYAASYWIMNPQGRDRIMQEYFQVEPTSTTANDPLASDRSLNMLRIAIQNASGQPEVGNRLAQYLAKQGFNNVYTVQDWPDPLRQTQIIVQQGDFSEAKTLKTMLGAGQIEATSTGDLDSDLTIRIGKDWSPKSVVMPSTKPSSQAQ